MSLPLAVCPFLSFLRLAVLFCPSANVSICLVKNVFFVSPDIHVKHRPKSHTQRMKNTSQSVFLVTTIFAIIPVIRLFSVYKHLFMNYYHPTRE